MSSHAALENLKQRLVSLQGSPTPNSTRDHQSQSPWYDDMHQRSRDQEFGRREGEGMAGTKIGVNDRMRTHEYGHEAESTLMEEAFRSAGSNDNDNDNDNDDSFDEEGRGASVQLLHSKLKVPLSQPCAKA